MQVIVHRCVINKRNKRGFIYNCSQRNGIPKNKSIIRRDGIFLEPWLRFCEAELYTYSEIEN